MVSLRLYRRSPELQKAAQATTVEVLVLSVQQSFVAVSNNLLTWYFNNYLGIARSNYISG